MPEGETRVTSETPHETISADWALKEKLQVLLYHRRMVAVVTVIGAFAIAVVSIFQHDRFTSEAILQVDMRPMKLSRFDDSMGSISGEEVVRYIETQAQLLRSWSVCRKTVERLEQQGIPTRDGGRMPVSRHPFFAGKNIDEISRTIQKDLIIRSFTTNHLIRVAFESTDPNLSREIVRQTVRSFQEMRTSAELDKLGSYSINVDKQLEDSRKKLDETREKLTKFYAETSISPGSTLINPLEKDKERLLTRSRRLEAEKGEIIDIVERLGKARREASEPTRSAALLKEFRTQDAELEEICARREHLEKDMETVAAASVRLAGRAGAGPAVVDLWKKLGTVYYKEQAARLDRERMRLLSRDYVCAKLHDLTCVVEDSSVSTFEQRLADFRQQRASMLESLGANHWKLKELQRRIAQLNTEKFRRIESVLAARENEYRGILRAGKELQTEMNKLQEKYTGIQEELATLELLRYNFQRAEELYLEMWRAKQAAAYSGRIIHNDIYVRQGAILPKFPSGPHRVGNVLLGTFMVFLFGCGLAFFLEYLDETIRTQADIEHIINAPLAGVLPHIATSGKNRSFKDLISHTSSKSIAAEAFRALRTSINLSLEPGGETGRTILLTSANASEGKTTLNINLATVFGQSMRKTLLVDCDLRRPAAHEPLQCSQSPGVSDLLARKKEFRECLIEGFGNNLPDFHFLPAGKPPENPAELLDTPRLKELLDWARCEYDIVIIDSPPVLLVTDALIIAPHSDGTLLATLSGRTRKSTARRAWELLAETHANLLGVVLNDTHQDVHSYGYGYYNYNRGYGYGYSGEEKKTIQGH